MNMPTPSQALPGVQEIRFPDFEVSFAGALGENDFCFGSEDGRLLSTDEAGVPFDAPQQASESGEAINGVAILGDSLAVTTRSDVNVIQPGTPGRRSVIPVGAHGVVATPNGYFAVALGMSGIAFVKPECPVNEQPLTYTTNRFYFYRLIAVSGHHDEDVIVAAGRHGGLGVASFPRAAGSLVLDTIGYATIDAVDVCSIATPAHPRALAAVGRDGTLIFVRDVLQDKTPQSLKFDTVSGIAYRLMHAQGSVFLLTSHAVYMLIDLASRFFEGETLGQSRTQVLTLPMEAADASVVRGRWLLALLAEKVYKFDIELLRQTAPLIDRSTQREQLPARIVAPTWEARGVPLTIGV